MKRKPASFCARLATFLAHELHDARGHLAHSSGRDASSRVHEVRKSIKKLRAALRLACDIFPAAAIHPVEDSLRSAAHALGPLRDSAVLQKTVADLLKQNEVPPTRGASPATTPATRRARRYLTRANIALEKLAWDDADSDAWKSGLKRLYRRGRKAMQQAGSTGSNEDLHKWRRRTKDFLYALDLLGKDFLPHRKSLMRRTKDLTDFLGEDHDLAFFEQKHAARHDQETFQPLYKRADKRRRDLQRMAFSTGRHVYRARPAKLAD